MGNTFETLAFSAVNMLYEKSYLTAKEADELKTRKIAKEINNVLCKHYTSVEGRLVYIEALLLEAAVRFIFCAPDGRKDFMIEVTNNVIEEIKEF